MGLSLVTYLVNCLLCPGVLVIHQDILAEKKNGKEQKNENANNLTCGFAVERLLVVVVDSLYSVLYSMLYNKL